ncbi:hypothetical protein SEA_HUMPTYDUMPTY_53 [Arthrobacter phage HumptyDumpty]|uniref:Uncharacterized protein n=4 Tax=Klausavirus princesstrina TaxID=1984784 RepID=A0A286N466_9CAUD|nr:hypothetical protein SEA_HUMPTYDUMPTY_53 [Arthrobacter phage HumptyDumpty]ASX99173.1 hypothetical protein SEA_TOPHAT_53 [Arthrobacter phage Tophat]QBP30424.1 hypothetical protein SEA_CHIPPER1996_53 [Arthrobacter phage Chipper1996]QEQ94159.1 hypothetical protein SEA_MORDRED_53 [Arthrobacter phage Mordred]
MTPTPDTTSIDHAPLSTTGENPVDKLIASIQSEREGITPARALALVEETLTVLMEAVPVEARERLSRLGATIAGYPDPEGARDAEAARERADAAHMRNRATGYELKAEALAAMTPEEWLAHKAARDTAQAKRSAERAEAREGAVLVDIDTHVTDTVRVERSEMKAAGWHHESQCKSGHEEMAGVTTVDEAAALRADTHYALQDWHDRAHGLIQWANCPHEPCNVLPEAAKVFKIGGRS